MLDTDFTPPPGARDALRALAGPGAVLFVVAGGGPACVAELGRSEIVMRVPRALCDWLVFSGAVLLAERSPRGRRYTLAPEGCRIGRRMGLWAS